MSGSISAWDAGIGAGPTSASRRDDFTLVLAADPERHRQDRLQLQPLDALELRETLVLAAKPTFELLATNKMADDMTASPVVADGKIYLRGFKTLYAIATK